MTAKEKHRYTNLNTDADSHTHNEAHIVRRTISTERQAKSRRRSTTRKMAMRFFSNCTASHLRDLLCEAEVSGKRLCVCVERCVCA